MNTKWLKVTPSNRDEYVNMAAQIIKSGGLVAFPTETVYGLGADGYNASAVRRIFEAKGRPRDNPLIVHVCSPEQAVGVAHFTDTAIRLAERFWPGPLTMVLNSRGVLCPEVQAGLDTVAVRMPDHALALDLIDAAGTPIAAPSANLSGRPSPTDGNAAYQDMDGRAEIILDGGPASFGVESTVVDMRGEYPVLLRPGGLSREDMESVAGRVILGDECEAYRSPGTKHRHYAPDAPVYVMEEYLPQIDQWDATGVPWGYIGMSQPPGSPAVAMVLDSYERYAASFFRALRLMDRRGVAAIVAEWPEGPDVGIILALRDRIRRASGA